jgi:hypothetical protein
MIAPGWKQLPRDERLPDVELLFQGPAGKSGLSIRTEPNMKTVGTKFKNLTEQLSTGRLSRLTVIRDSRVPLTKTAKVARKNLEELEQHGAVVVHPSIEALAALDALRALLSDAKSGDLDRNGETVSPQTVEEWFKLHLNEELRTLTALVLGVENDDAPSDSSDIGDLEALHTLLAERPVISLEEAALALERSIEDVAVIARRHAHQIRMIGQPPTMLFRAVEQPESSPA